MNKFNMPALFICASFFSTQCSTQAPPAILGKIELAGSGIKPMVYLIQPRNFNDIACSYLGLVLDSAQIDANGKFAFFRTVKSETLLELCVQQHDSRFANKLLNDDPQTDNYMPLILQPGETVEIDAHASGFQASFAILNPSGPNQDLLALRDIRLKAFENDRMLLTRKAEDSESDLLSREAALHRFRTTLFAFADSCPKLLPALVAARWASPEADYERVAEPIAKLCLKWREKLPDNQYVMQFCGIADPNRLPVLNGDLFPDASLPMSNGDTIKMSGLLGKKLTIVDIWASWCLPCRRENKSVLLPLWQSYRNGGLQIVGYSIDASRGAWKSAIAKDSASWPQASDLKGDDAPLMQKLRISTIPANYLLNAEGRIVAKNLHGQELEAFVKDYFKR